MQKQFEPTEAQKKTLSTAVEKRFEAELQRWPIETTANYSYSKDHAGAKTATVVFYVGQKSLSADFMLTADDSWYCTRDWRD